MFFYIVVLFFFLVYKAIYSVLPMEPVNLLPLVLIGYGTYRYAFFYHSRMYIGRILNPVDLAIYTMFVVIFALSILRKNVPGATLIGNINQSLQYCLLAYFTYVFFTYRFKIYQQYGGDFRYYAKQVIFLLAITPIVFVTLDALLYLLGFTGEKADLEGHKSVVGSLLGLDIGRTHFFLGGHHNNFAVSVGAMLTIVIVSLLIKAYQRKQRVFLIMALASCIFCMLLADVRGAIASVIVAVAAIFLLRSRKKTHLLPYLVLLPFVLTLFSLPVLSALEDSNLEIFAMLSRNPGELFTLNNRIYIWQECFDEMANPKLNHLVGYGQAGHVASGLQKNWAWILPGRVTHNIYLQLFLDSGYIGLFSFIAVLVVSVRSALYLYQQGIKEALILMAFTLYYSLSGLSEVILGQYNHLSTAIFLLFSLAPILLRNLYLQSTLAKPDRSEKTYWKVNEKPHLANS